MTITIHCFRSIHLPYLLHFEFDFVAVSYLLLTRPKLRIYLYNHTSIRASCLIYEFAMSPSATIPEGEFRETRAGEYAIRGGKFNDPCSLCIGVNRPIS